jgi:muramoyltetrapeptide carboxypeptidase LdcA involved in peptidoglycan recycling
LIVISTSPYLSSNHGRSIPAVLTMVVAVLIVIACAVALRLSAEATRDAARRRLTERLIQAKGNSTRAAFVSQLELMLRRIEELRDGAFSPFSQQPVVRAMLLPLGGFGGTALLSYVMGFGFG